MTGTSSYSTGRPAESYTTQSKSSTTSKSSKTSKSSSSGKTASTKTASTKSKTSGTTKSSSTSAYSTGRPAESYIPQQKASTAKGKTSTKTTQAKPVATQAPVTAKKKKDPSEASYSNGRPQQSYTLQSGKNSPYVKNYTPTASREGAGTPFYSPKTKPTGAKEAASFGTSLFPYVGDAKDIQEALTGKDLITGKKLTKGERIATSVAAVLPVATGPMLKSAGKGVTIAAKEAPKAVKGAKQAGSKIAKRAEPVVKKAAEKTDVAVDTAKELKNKAVKVLKGVAGKSGSTTKPNQVHHYATNKSKTYTPQLEKIAKKYEFDLDDAWNKDLLPHQGRHPNAYHEYVLDSMKQFDDIAQGDKGIFLKLFDNLKNNVKSNPDMLYKDYWK